jgi:hypothetical protein
LFPQALGARVGGRVISLAIRHLQRPPPLRPAPQGGGEAPCTLTR